MKRYLFLQWTNMKQALFSLKFIIVTLLICCILFLTVLPAYTSTLDVVGLLSIGLGGTHGNLMLVLGTLPIIPFAISFATDWEQKVIHPWIIRSGVYPYATAKVITSVLSAFLATFFGLSIFELLASIGLPFHLNSYGVEPYMYFIDHNQTVLYFIFYNTHMALSSFIFAGIAFFVSTMIPNKFVTIAAPVVFYYLSHRFTSTLDIPIYTKALTIFEGVYNPGTPAESILYKFTTSIIIVAILSVLSIIQIRRRMLHA